MRMFKKFAQICLLSSSILLINNAVVAEAATPSEIKTQAYTYLGVPYLYGGTTTKGFDCSGYVQRVFKDLGIDLPRTAASQYQVGKNVAKSNLEVGDLVFFNTTGKGISHVGIYVGGNQFINSSSSKGVSVASINDPYYWGSKYVGAKRVLTEEVKSASIDMSIYASRAEVAQKLTNSLNLKSKSSSTYYKDVKVSSKYLSAINAVTEANIFAGDQGNFNPSKPITRAQIAKVLVEAYDLKPGKGSWKFKDVKTDHWAYDYVQILAQNGITIGKEDGSYGLNEYVTFKHIDTFIERAEKR